MVISESGSGARAIPGKLEQLELTETVDWKGIAGIKMHLPAISLVLKTLIPSPRPTHIISNYISCKAQEPSFFCTCNAFLAALVGSFLSFLAPFFLFSVSSVFFGSFLAFLGLLCPVSFQPLLAGTN